MTNLNVDNKFFYEILKDTNEIDVLNNLKEIKNKIFQRVNSEADLKLINGYLSLYEKNNLLSKTGLYLFASLTFFSSSLVTNRFTTPTNINTIIERIFMEESSGQFKNTSDLIEIIGYIFPFLALVYFVYHEFTKEKRRIQFIRMILNVIIEEKEKEREREIKASVGVEGNKSG